MQRFTPLVIAIACIACEKKTAKPAPTGTIVDEGTLVTTLDGKVNAREKFSIHKDGDKLVLRASSATVDGAKVPSQQEGELETDLAYKPIRGTYRYTAKQDGFRYTLGGTPLTLDRIRDDGEKPQHIVASGPVELFVEIGLIGLTALCRVEAPATLNSIADFESGYRGGKVVVKTVGKAAGLKKLTVKYLEEFEVEVYCDGDKLVASGLRGNKLWHVREGRETDFAAARDAP
ncbi:MAG: hypothetical protein H0T46_25975 [Deltaproteobacteria bacterium]|nr:hypothetical protein [Deltaproteobacteria bacterium]